ncbi:hypothetical protein PFISCL1PPCAC_14400, partial [Pristionchus fissidentatus]
SLSPLSMPSEIAYKEPQLCRISAVKIARVLLIFTLLISFVEVFLFISPAATVPFIAQIISFLGSSNIIFIFPRAIKSRSAKWILPSLLLDLYNIIFSFSLFVIAIITYTGSDSFMCQQIKSYFSDDNFVSYVNRVHKGNVEEVCIDFGTFMGVIAMVLVAFHSFSYNVHFMLLKSFRRHSERIQRQTLREAQRIDSSLAEFLARNEDLVIYLRPDTSKLPKYEELAETPLPPAYETSTFETSTPPQCDEIPPEYTQ